MKKYLLLGLVPLLLFSHTLAYDFWDNISVSVWTYTIVPSWVIGIDFISDTINCWVDIVRSTDWWYNSVEFMTLSNLWQYLFWDYEWQLYYGRNCYNWWWSVIIRYIYPDPPLVPDWTLNSVVGGVGSVVGEFIPYVVYIWFWVLIASLWFVAIKWLLSYLYQKVKKTFRSK